MTHLLSQSLNTKWKIIRTYVQAANIRLNKAVELCNYHGVGNQNAQYFLLRCQVSSSANIFYFLVNWQCMSAYAAVSQELLESLRLPMRKESLKLI